MTFRTRPLPMPVKGIDQLSDETALLEGTARVLDNVDLRRDGTVARREGYTALDSSVGWHSLYYSERYNRLFVCRGDSLLELNEEGGFTSTPITQLLADSAVDFAEYNGHIYLVNSGGAAWIPNGDEPVREVGLPVPRPPDLEVSTGSLPAGSYTAVVVMVDPRGEESPASEQSQITLQNSGGIRVGNIPTAPGFRARAYVSTADGDVLRLAVDAPAAGAPLTVDSIPQGKECQTRFLRGLPGGQYICPHKGRLLVASGDTLFFSQPLRPHLHNPAYDYIAFSGSIRMLVAVEGGVYVADDRGVWFLQGSDMSQVTKRRVNSELVVPSSGILVDPSVFGGELQNAPSACAVWLAESGYAVGLPDGMVVDMHASQVRIDTGFPGRSALLIREGRKQVLTTVNSSDTARFGNAVDSIIP